MPKRFILLISFAFIISGLEVAQATSTQNPAHPALLKGDKVIPIGERIALYAETEFSHVSNKRFATEGDEYQFTSIPNRIGFVWDNLAQVYFIAGAGQAKQKFDINHSPQDVVTFDTEWSFVGGVGGSVVLLQQELSLFGGSTLFLGIDANIIWFDPEVDKLTVNGVLFKKSDPGVTSHSYDFKEFQASLGAALAIGRYVPYAGIKFSDTNGQARATVNGTEHNVTDLEQAYKVGVFTGADVLANDNLSLNVEGRFIDETAVSGSLRYRF